MSFARAAQEIADLERRAAELEHAAKVKDAILARSKRGLDCEPADDTLLSQVVEGLQSENATSVVEAIKAFLIKYENAEGGFDITKAFGQLGHSRLVSAVSKRLETRDNSTAQDKVLELTLKLARALLRDSRASCSALTSNAVKFFLAKVVPANSLLIRDAAIRAFQACIAGNVALRDLLVENEQAIDSLTLLIEGLGKMMRSQDDSPNGECARLIVTLKGLFEGTSSEGDKLIARLFLKSGFVSAVVERMTKAYIEVADIPNKSLRAGEYPLISTTAEGTSRGTLLVDGFRFLYIVAIFADQEMLETMMKNDGLPTLAGEELEKCELTRNDLGVGDRYVFLQTHVLMASTPFETIKKDVNNFDTIKISVCSILMFADKAPGFVAYLFRHDIGRAIFELIDRETTRVKAQEKKEEDLLPILIATKTLVDNSDDFKDQFQEMFFERLVPDLDPADYNTEDDYNQAREKRHYAGRSIPDTVFGKVVALLTSFDDHVKRYAGELLFFLCDDDPNKVTHLVGFGHAAHILAIKGGMLGSIGAQ